MPSAASLSATGVRAIFPPLQPSESYRIWSVVMKRIFRPMSPPGPVALRHGDQARVDERRRPVLADALVFLARHHGEECLSRRVLDEDHFVPAVGCVVADDNRVCASAPEHLRALLREQIADLV